MDNDTRYLLRWPLEIQIWRSRLQAPFRVRNSRPLFELARTRDVTLDTRFWLIIPFYFNEKVVTDIYKARQRIYEVVWIQM